MELELTPDQDDLRATVQTVLAAECPPARVREIVEARIAGTPDPPDALWKQMVDLGWPALAIPEAFGGLGRGTIELAVVAEQLGRVMAPGPLLPTITQFVPALLELGSPAQQERFLRPVAEAGAAGTLALAEANGGFDPAFVAAAATPLADGAFRLDGEKHFVMEATVADEIVVIARLAETVGDDGIAAFVVPAADVTITPVAALDASRVLAGVTLDGVPVPADRVLGVPGPATATALRRAIETATVALALECVGTAQTAFDVSLEYAKQREQFGVPIGSFQAIKHKLTDMFVLLERARALSYFAALTIAEDDERRSLSTAMAKAAAGDAQQRIAKEGIQIHGGIGYTWEHDMHLYVRRMTSNATLFGNAHTHRQHIADLLHV